MKPALLILIMDFLVASLFLYVSDDPSQRNGSSSRQMTDSTHFFQVAVAEFDNEIEQSSQEYYARYQHSVATSEIYSLLKDKQELSTAVLKREEELLKKNDDIVQLVQNLEQSKNEIVSYNSTILTLNETVQQQSFSLDRLTDKSSKLTNELLTAREREQDYYESQKEHISKIETLQEELLTYSSKLAETESKAAQTEDLKKRIAELEHEKSLIQFQLVGKIDEVNQEIGAVKTGQEKTSEQLLLIDTKISELPQEIKRSLNEIVDQGKQRLEITQSIQDALQQHTDTLKGEIANELKKDFDELKKQSAQLEILIQQAKSESDAEISALIAKDIQAQNQAISNLQSSIDSKGAAAISRSSSSENASGVNQARVELLAVIAEKGMLWGVNTDEIRTHPITVNIGNSNFVISHKSSVGLDNSKITSGDLSKADFSLRFDETIPPQSMLLSYAFSLNRQCKVIATPAPSQQKGLPLFKSEQEIKYAKLNDLFIYKHEIKMGFHKISSDTPLEIKNDGNIQLEYSWFASHKPRKGDFLVTQDGHFLCVMDHSNVCLTITEENFSSKGTSFDFGSTRNLSETTKSYNLSCKN